MVNTLCLPVLVLVAAVAFSNAQNQQSSSSSSSSSGNGNGRQQSSFSSSSSNGISHSEFSSNSNGDRAPQVAAFSSNSNSGKGAQVNNPNFGSASDSFHLDSSNIPAMAGCGNNGAVTANEGTSSQRVGGDGPMTVTHTTFTATINGKSRTFNRGPVLIVGDRCIYHDGTIEEDGQSRPATDSERQSVTRWIAAAKAAQNQKMNSILSTPLFRVDDDGPAASSAGPPQPPCLCKCCATGSTGPPPTTGGPEPKPEGRPEPVASTGRPIGPPAIQIEDDEEDDDEQQPGSGRPTQPGSNGNNAGGPSSPAQQTPSSQGTPSASATGGRPQQPEGGQQPQRAPISPPGSAPQQPQQYPRGGGPAPTDGGRP